MSNIVEELESDDAQLVKKNLEKFIRTYENVYKFTDISDDERDRLWSILHKLLKETQDSTVQELALCGCRLLSRDKHMVHSTVISEDFINTLLECSSLNQEVIYESSVQNHLTAEAVKCLCNMVFNSQAIQQMCSNNGVLDALISRLRTYPGTDIPYEVKLFDLKLLFLVSALVSDTRIYLKKELHALTYLMEILDFILKSDSCSDTQESKDKVLLSAESTNLACEILKVMFNLTIKETPLEISEDYESSLRMAAILRELLVCSTPPDMSDTLCSQVINLLTNMPNSSLELLMPQDDDICSSDAIDRLLKFLCDRLSDTPDSQLMEVLCPALTVLIVACKHHRVIRRHVRQSVLPPLMFKDVKHRPEEGNTLRNKLCRLLTSLQEPIRDLVADLLFILCKENVNRMVKYTGFGNAAGLLAQKGLLAGGKESTDYSSDSEEDSDTEEYKIYKDKINPVTGTYELPKPNPTEGMTEEQKEFEAMQLVNMMDKLSRDGIVQPCRIAEDGTLQPVDHILQLQEDSENHLKNKEQNA